MNRLRDEGGQDKRDGDRGGRGRGRTGIARNARRITEMQNTARPPSVFYPYLVCSRDCFFHPPSLPSWVVLATYE